VNKISEFDSELFSLLNAWLAVLNAQCRYVRLFCRIDVSWEKACKTALNMNWLMFQINKKSLLKWLSDQVSLLFSWLYSAVTP